MTKLNAITHVLLMLMLGSCGNASQFTTNATPTHATDPTKIVSTPTENLSSQTILLADTGADYYFEDLRTGHIERWEPENLVFKVLGWGEYECSLIAQLDSSISVIDMKGNLLDTIISFESLPASNGEGRKSVPTLSPNQKYLYYTVGYGEPLVYPDLAISRFEKEYIELMQIEDVTTSVRIPSNGGSWIASWSPNSMLIAYSDYDSNGNLQIFTATFDGKNIRQVSFFDSKVEFLKIEWSPNSRYFIAPYDADSDWAADATFFADTSNDHTGSLENIAGWWWQDDNSIVGGEIINNGLIVLDVFEGSSLDSFQEIDYRGYLVGQFRLPNLVGYFNRDGHFSTYNTKNGKHEIFVNSSIPDSLFYSLSYWLALPDSMENCR